MSPPFLKHMLITVIGEDRYWKRLKAGGEGDDRRWDVWMASLTWCTWVEQALGVGDG